MRQSERKHSKRIWKFGANSRTRKLIFSQTQNASSVPLKIVDEKPQVPNEAPQGSVPVVEGQMVVHPPDLPIVKEENEPSVLEYRQDVFRDSEIGPMGRVEGEPALSNVMEEKAPSLEPESRDALSEKKQTQEVMRQYPIPLKPESSRVDEGHIEMKEMAESVLSSKETEKRCGFFPKNSARVATK